MSNRVVRKNADRPGVRVAFAVLLLSLPLLGQTLYSGPGTYAGPGAYGPLAGAPLVYNARTDSCVHGYSTNPPTAPPFYCGVENGCNPPMESCVAGRTTGQSGSALVFQEGASDPVPFLRLDDASTPAVVNTSFSDPDFNSYSVFVTDQSTNVATNNWNMGSDGAYDAFSLGSNTDTLLTFNNTGSVPYLVHIIPQRFFAHTCSVANPCIVKSNIHGANCDPGTTCSNTQITSGAISFSRSPSDPPNTLYEVNVPKVYKTAWTSHLAGGFPDGAGDTVSRVLYVDFSSDSGGAIPCTVIPADYASTWNGTFSVSNTGAITIASSGAGSYQTIGNGSGGAQAITADTFIKPVNNNPGGANGKWMFQGTNGTTTGSEPNWAANCPALGDTCSDGPVTWTNIGIVNGQDQGHDVLHFDPARGCSRENTRLTKIYRGTNEGPNWPNPGTPDASGPWITDDAVVCYRMGGTNCGTGGTVALTDAFTLHAAGQKLQSQYGGMGTAGGAINDNYVGGGGNPIAAAGNGSCTPAIAYTAFASWPNTAWVSGTPYTAGQYVSDPVDHNYYSASHNVASTTAPHLDAANWVYKSSYCYNYIVDWYSNMVHPILELGPNYGGDGHSVAGYLYDYRGGKRFTHLYGQPNCQNTTGACAGQYVGSPNPGVAILSSGKSFDSHPSYRNVGTQDLQPIFEPTTLVPTWGGVGIRGVCGGGPGVGAYCEAGVDEEIAITTDGTETMYRFGHNYCTGSSSYFQTQNCIGVVSQDGKMLAWSSDFMNTRGDANGAATCSSPLRAQYQPAKNGCVMLNDFVLPINNNASNDIFKITSTGSAGQGTCAAGQFQEASTLPNWNTSCTNAGDVCTDGNGLQFTNQGPNSCRGDVGLMELLPAH